MLRFPTLVRAVLALSWLPLLLSPHHVSAQDAAPKPAAGTATNAPADAATGIREVSPGVFELGDVRLDQKARTVTFPGAINMDKGVVEYLLVGKNGPTHESLLVTTVRPAELHTVMLLLGLKGSKTPPADAPPPQLTRDYLKHAPKLEGENLDISVTWKDPQGKEKSATVAELLKNSQAGKPASKGPWTYTGSGFSADGKFLAQAEDVFGAMVVNPAALINNPRPGNDDDRIWEVNEKATPPAQTPVTIRLHILDSESSTGGK